METTTQSSKPKQSKKPTNMISTALGEVLGTAVAITPLVGIYLVCKSLFIYLITSGLGLFGCWGITLLVGATLITVLDKLIVAMTGGL